MSDAMVATGLVCSCGCGASHGCLREKLDHWRQEGLNIAPSALSTRTRAVPAERSDWNNPWERGVPRDNRGMPYLAPGTLDPIGQKKFSETRRSYEAAKRMPPQTKE